MEMKKDVYISHYNCYNSDLLKFEEICREQMRREAKW